MVKVNQSSTSATSLEDEPPPAPEWKKILKNSITSAREFAAHFKFSEEELRGLERVCETYPSKVNSYYLSLIKERDDPIYKQCIPSIKEITDSEGEEDPLHEETINQSRQGVPSLITHRYSDRALFLISNKCAMYCRFCTRKRKVGHKKSHVTKEQLESGFKYLNSHQEIRDIILSGGDPLLLENSSLEKIISKAHGIIKKRKGILRIGTKIPCVLPQRITPDLCEMLKKYHPLYINTHFNHPLEITPESEKACNMLADAGIPLGNQTVLLKGVNNNAGTMIELVKRLVNIRVKPYYIYQADPVKGTNHFRTKVEEGMEIYRSMRGHISGVAIPYLVIDAPGGGGKIPIIPDYIISINEKEVVLRNYENKVFKYPQTKDD